MLAIRCTGSDKSSVSPQTCFWTPGSVSEDVCGARRVAPRRPTKCEERTGSISRVSSSLLCKRELSFSSSLPLLFSLARAVKIVPDLNQHSWKHLFDKRRGEHAARERCKVQSIVLFAIQETSHASDFRVLEKFSSGVELWHTVHRLRFLFPLFSNSYSRNVAQRPNVQ